MFRLLFLPTWRLQILTLGKMKTVLEGGSEKEEKSDVDRKRE